MIMFFKGLSKFKTLRWFYRSWSMKSLHFRILTNLQMHCNTLGWVLTCDGSLFKLVKEPKLSPTVSGAI